MRNHNTVTGWMEDWESKDVVYTLTPTNDTYNLDTTTLDTSTLTTVTVDDVNATGFGWSDSDGNITINTLEPVEFEDNMPSVAKVEDMCNDYPALDTAYKNFKLIYKLVHQDWKGRQKDNGTIF